MTFPKGILRTDSEPNGGGGRCIPFDLEQTYQRVQKHIEDKGLRYWPSNEELRELYAEPNKLWNRVDESDDGAVFFCKTFSLQVIRSIERHKDSHSGILHKWLHVSVVKRLGPQQFALPNYNDMALVKADFVGADKKAIMVFPAATEHVNIHPYCLHFYSPLEHDPLPDFTEGAKSI